MLDAAHNALRYCWQYEDKGRAQVFTKPWPMPMSITVVHGPRNLFLFRLLLLRLLLHMLILSAQTGGVYDDGSSFFCSAVHHTLQL